MTIIEFFDEEITDNAIGTILLRPQRTVFLYNEKKNESFLTALENVQKKRGVKTLLSMEYIDTSCLETAKAKLEEIVEKYPDCDFDIAGGSDIMLVAIGETAKKHNLPLHTVDVKNKSVLSVNGDKKYDVCDTFLSVEELISLHGGRITCPTANEETYTWERNAATEEDIEKVWNICKSDPGAWNAAIGALRGFRSDKKSILTMIWSKLKKENLVRKDTSAVKYKNDVVKYLLAKQGTALEMFTFIAAKSTMFFDDGKSGVIIDWKGRREVENEIDVILTKGAIGYFISCKNGMVDSDELYKLNTVAARFGGRYAEKILVLSAFEPDVSFMNRAKELNIRVIKNVRYLSKKDFAKRIIN